MHGHTFVKVRCGISMIKRLVYYRFAAEQHIFSASLIYCVFKCNSDMNSASATKSKCCIYIQRIENVRARLRRLCTVVVSR